MSSKQRVALLAGGRSSEHTISLVSASSVLRALDRERFEPVCIIVTPAGEWRLVDESALDVTLETVEPAAEGIGEPVVLAGAAGSARLVRLDAPAGERDVAVDVWFPLFHGRFGEDGTVQGMLELFGCRYVGAGVFASAAAQDKHMTKVLVQAAGIPVVPWTTVSRSEWEQGPERVRQSVAAQGSAVFVKPARAGSSVGVTRVDDPSGDALTEAIEEALRHDSRVLIEHAVEARELEMGVLGDRGQGVRVAGPGEIVLPEDGFYDFDTKYSDGGAEIRGAKDLSQENAEQLARWAALAFQAIGGAGLARVDFFYTPDGRILLNEINTLPGFTAASMFPAVWHSAGFSLPRIVTELIELALAEER